MAVCCLYMPESPDNGWVGDGTCATKQYRLHDLILDLGFGLELVLCCTIWILCCVCCLM